MKHLIAIILGLTLALPAVSVVTQADIEDSDYILVGEIIEFTDHVPGLTDPLFIKIDKCVFVDPIETKAWRIPQPCPNRLVLMYSTINLSGGK